MLMGSPFDGHSCSTQCHLSLSLRKPVSRLSLRCTFHIMASATTAARPGVLPRLCSSTQRQSRRSSAAAHRTCAAAGEGELRPELPRSAATQVRLASAATQRALADGLGAQRVELELPLIGATDLDDWPGGTRQQLRALQPLLMQLLTLFHGSSTQVATTVLDEADAVSLFTTQTHRAVTFVTADTLQEVQKLVANDPQGCLLLVNSSWNNEDFGWGPFTNTPLKSFAQSLSETFSLRPLRIRGQDMRILRAYPSPYVVFALGIDGEREKSEAIGSTPERPTYSEVEALLGRLGSRSIANADLATRLRYEVAFNKDTLAPPPPPQ